mgnify:CR=1 FL=1
MFIFVWITISAMEGSRDKKKQERGVVHLLIKATSENFYYGNLKALFDNHEQVENDKSLGVAYNYVKNFDFSDGKAYENSICVIRKGIINTTTKKEWMRNNKNTNRK